MKFTVAWSKVVNENATLKGAILSLSCISVFFGFASLKLALKEPIVVERGCYSKVLSKADSKRSNLEIEAFLKEALSQRFDSNVQPRDGYVSDDELGLRTKEQKEFQSRKILQKVILNTIDVEGSSAVVDLDRVISVGDIRSAFKFPIKVSFESIARSEGNPYGLVVSEIKVLEKENK
jgi:hypothetical protein